MSDRAMRAASVCAVLLALSARCWAAHPSEPDATDLWWDADEPGWGVNVIHQSNVLFMTFFIYGADGRARWYVASETRCSGAPRDMEQICSGPLYEATGPVVAPGFDPARVQRRLVGDVSFLYRRPYGASISYRIDGQGAGRMMRRQTWALNDISGEFFIQRVHGADSRPWIGCPGVATTTRDLGRVIVQQSGTQVRLFTEPGPWPRCDYAGTYSQEGRMGRIAGTFTCTATDAGGASTPAESGTFELDEVEVGPRGFMARYTASTPAGQFCRVWGNFAGARATLQ